MKKLALISAAICAFGSYVSTAEASTDVNLKLLVMGDITLDVTPDGSDLEIQAIPDPVDGTYKATGISYKSSTYQGIRLKANRALENYSLTVAGQSDASPAFRLQNKGPSGDGDHEGPDYISYNLKLGENDISSDNGANNNSITVEKDSNMDFSIVFSASLGELVAGEQYRDSLTFTFTPPEV
ncbi:MAG: hypothetical protein LBT67_01245 [Holosporaceae bacterium]|jgi:hypothetical protein|nr:hypothetical protein [Holosporaceae bacterium]